MLPGPGTGTFRRDLRNLAAGVTLTGVTGDEARHNRAEPAAMDGLALMASAVGLPAACTRVLRRRRPAGATDLSRHAGLPRGKAGARGHRVRDRQGCRCLSRRPDPPSD